MGPSDKEMRALCLDKRLEFMDWNTDGWRGDTINEAVEHIADLRAKLERVTAERDRMIGAAAEGDFIARDRDPVDQVCRLLADAPKVLVMLCDERARAEAAEAREAKARACYHERTKQLVAMEEDRDTQLERAEAAEAEEAAMRSECHAIANASFTAESEVVGASMRLTAARVLDAGDRAGEKGGA